MTAIVLDRAGIVDFHYLVFSRNAVWAVASFSLVATILNVITPSKKERAVWAPDSSRHIRLSILQDGKPESSAKVTLMNPWSSCRAYQRYVIRNCGDAWQ